MHHVLIFSILPDTQFIHYVGGFDYPGTAIAFAESISPGFDNLAVVVPSDDWEDIKDDLTTDEIVDIMEKLRFEEKRRL